MKTIVYEQDAIEREQRAHGMRASIKSLYHQLHAREDLTPAMRSEAGRRICDLDREAAAIERDVRIWREETARP